MATTRRTPVSADGWIQRVRRLEAEVAGLRLAMRNRGAIEQAKGILAERLGIDPEQAFHQLSAASQHTNARLTDVAADVLGSVTAGPTAPVPLAQGDAGDLLRRLNRLRATLPSAESPEDLVARIGAEVAAGVGASSVLLYASTPEGGLRLIGAYGLSRAAAADWRHIPSGVGTALGLAIRTARPVWVEPPYPDDAVLIGPTGPRLALPVTLSRWQVAGLEVSWPEGIALGARERDWLTAIGELAGRRLVELTDTNPDSEPDDSGPDWVSAAIDAVLTPAALLSPLHDNGGTIQDFVIDYANQAALHAWARTESPLGRRLLDVEPELLVHGGLDELIAAYETSSGQSPSAHRRAHRLGHRLLATWLDVPADSAIGESMLATMERLGGFGVAVWTPSLAPVTWSTGLHSLLGRETSRGPGDLATIRARVTQPEKAELDDVLHAAAAGRTDARTTLHLAGADGGLRAVRIVAAPRRGADGSVRAILTLFQDLTDSQRRDDQVHRIGQRLATQQLHLATQRAQAEQLQETFFPPPRTKVRLPGFELIARHAAPHGIPAFRGDFYDIGMADGKVMLTVGDVYGAGIDAAGAMVRLRHAARALTIAGFGPAHVLRLLNEELCGDDEPPMASAIVAEVRVDGSELCWAQAGHYSPILLRGGRARSLRRPRGGALGLRLETEFTDARARVMPGDVLIFYTDGALDRATTDQPVRRLAADLLAAYTKGGPAAVVDLPRPTQDEACVVALNRAVSSA